MNFRPACRTNVELPLCTVASKLRDHWAFSRESSRFGVTLAKANPGRAGGSQRLGRSAADEGKDWTRDDRRRVWDEFLASDIVAPAESGPR